MDENTLSQEDVWLKRYSRAIPIWFQGLWDTVGALGVPGPLIPRVSKDDFAFLETDLRINYTHAYHALAIDEHRQAFAPTLWVKNTPKQGDTYPARDLAHYAQEASTEELELCRQHPRRIRQAKRRAVEPR
ncbi:T6SS phospholipase effector Tle1-like catalytic domain-containing protein [Pseudomonas sp. RIT-To-2]|uniref:T6SS phospholipase effector Tle1-like catalytic domain-containing protein n=1 Tax=Pseudomonas sp. RIT-To-2 TaxID=3462541 RepID=UPI002413A3B2